MVDNVGIAAALRDDVLAEEIVLLGEVMAAAIAVGRALSQAETDAALGLAVGRVGRPSDSAGERHGQHSATTAITPAGATPMGALGLF